MGINMAKDSTVTYKCLNCNAGLVFDAAKQTFHCEFCLSDFDEGAITGAKSQSETIKNSVENDEFAGHMLEYHCPNCGADIAADESTAADYCYYCHNPVVLTGKLSGQMKPHKIIPFKFDKTAAEEKFLKYASKRWFVPKRFFSKEQTEKIAGVYFPFWVTDADTESNMQAKATKIRVWRLGNMEYTETSKYDIFRRGDIHFEDIVTSAFSEENKKMLEGILPYPSDSLISFTMPYLLGFHAKKRDIEREAISGEVRKRMNTYAEQLLRGTVNGYTAVTNIQTNIDIKNSNWDYTLMPLWILTYIKKGKTKEKDKIYTFAMNGYTEKIYGELPISFAKIGILFGSVIVGATAILSLMGGLLL